MSIVPLLYNTFVEIERKIVVQKYVAAVSQPVTERKYMLNKALMLFGGSTGLCCNVNIVYCTVVNVPYHLIVFRVYHSFYQFVICNIPDLFH